MQNQENTTQRDIDIDRCKDAFMKVGYELHNLRTKYQFKLEDSSIFDYTKNALHNQIGHFCMIGFNYKNIGDFRTSTFSNEKITPNSSIQFDTSNNGNILLSQSLSLPRSTAFNITRKRSISNQSVIYRQMKSDDTSSNELNEVDFTEKLKLSDLGPIEPDPKEEIKEEEFEEVQSKKPKELKKPKEPNEKSPLIKKRKTNIEIRPYMIEHRISDIYTENDITNFESVKDLVFYFKDPRHFDGDNGLYELKSPYKDHNSGYNIILHIEVTNHLLYKWTDDNCIKLNIVNGDICCW